jgi:WD40 repeat protein
LEVKLVSETKLEGGVYALTFSPDGGTVAAAGEDGHVRLISTASGKVTKDFVPVPVTAATAATVTRAETAKPKRR